MYSGSVWDKNFDVEPVMISKMMTATDRSLLTSLLTKFKSGKMLGSAFPGRPQVVEWCYMEMYSSDIYTAVPGAWTNNCIPQKLIIYGRWFTTISTLKVM